VKSFDVIRTIADFCDHVRRKAAEGDLSAALELVGSFVIDVISRESSIGRVFSSRELDQLCLELGRDFDAGGVPEFSRERSVFLVTGVGKTGGHSRVLRDLIVADGASEPKILVTNFRMMSHDVERLYADTRASVEYARGDSAALKLRWVQKRLAEWRPSRVYILQHHFDPICVAAVQPNLVEQLFYYHNCDHSLALGVHIPHAIHVDFNGKGFHHCRESEGVAGNVVWPLSVPEPVDRGAAEFLQHGNLVTCCCGGFEKFDLPHLSEQVPYAITYPRTIPVILSATQGSHIHIGELKPEMQELIAGELSKSGIEKSQFIHIPYVPNLANALVQHKVDVYLGSFPRGGGRATVEAMAAGMPLLVHRNYRSVFFTDANEIYPGGLAWGTKEELVHALRQLHSKAELVRHSQSARRFYREHHSFGALQEAMERTIRGEQQDEPSRPNYRPDALQVFLDECASSSSRLNTSGLDVAEGATSQRLVDPARPVGSVKTKDLILILAKRLKYRAQQALGTQ